MKAALKSVAVAFLQLVAANLVTLAASFLVTSRPQDRPVFFAVIAGAAFGVGIVLVGLLAVRLRWLPGPPRAMLRVALSFAGVYAVLVVGLLLGEIREASRFFFVAMVAGIVAFHAPGWFGGRDGGEPTA